MSTTQIFPIRNGVSYLGWHIYLAESGKVIRKVKAQTKARYKKKLRYMQRAYREGELSTEDIRQILSSYHAHFAYGHTYRLQERALRDFVLTKRG